MMMHRPEMLVSVTLREDRINELLARYGIKGISPKLRATIERKTEDVLRSSVGATFMEPYPTSVSNAPGRWIIRIDSSHKYSCSIDDLTTGKRASHPDWPDWHSYTKATIEAIKTAERAIVEIATGGKSRGSYRYA